MRWHVRQSMTSAGRAWNEDERGARGCLAWILDGAGLGRTSQFGGHETDAEWLVGFAGSMLDVSGDEGLGLDRALNDLAHAITSKFMADADEPSGGPSACLVAAQLLRIDANGSAMIDLAVIGDSVALVPTTDGDVRVITDTRVMPFEAKSLAALAAAGPRTTEAVPDVVRQQIRLNRAFVNTDAGYAVMSPTRPWLHLVLHEPVTLPPDAALVLATDGATRLFDLFETMTPRAFHAAAVAGRCQELVDRLRALELADPRAAAHPRMKIHDDATILVVTPVR